MESRVLVGIRRRNGTFYLAEHDPDGLSLVFNDPDFYNPDEELVERFITSAKDAEVQQEIHPSEHGVILIDLIHRMVLSRQDYCSIGRFSVMMLDLRKIQLAIKLRDRGVIGRMYVEPKSDEQGVTAPNMWGTSDREFPYLVKLVGEGRKKAFDFLERAVEASKGVSEHYNLYYRPPPEWGINKFVLDVLIPGLLFDDRRGERGYEHWGDVLLWLKHTRWRVPVWTKKQVAAYLREITPPPPDRLH